MNIKRRLCAVGVVLLIFLCVIMTGLQQRKQYDSVNDAMVYLINGNQGGNGSIYKITEDELEIVTTYHLLQNSNEVMVYFPDQLSVSGNVFLVNAEHDVGFVKVDSSLVSEETLKNLDCIVYDDKTYGLLETGDGMEYRYLEWNNGHVSAVTRIGRIGHMNWYVEELTDHLIYNYCDVEPGMSGCAAVAEDGSYIGMMIGGNQNESGALSIKVIERIYAGVE